MELLPLADFDLTKKIKKYEFTLEFLYIFFILQDKSKFLFNLTLKVIMPETISSKTLYTFVINNI